MSKYDARMLHSFLLLRREGALLGIEELLDAFKTAEAGYGGESEEALTELLMLLWCKSPEDRLRFRHIWQMLAKHPDEKLAPLRPDETVTSRERALGPTPRKPPERPTPPPPAPERKEEGFASLPVRAPYMPAANGDRFELQHYYPVSRRFMTYSWRYLKRAVPEGPLDEVDLAGTVERAALQGFYLAPVLRRRLTNVARLVMLLDQLGSMAPFHHYLRDLVDTAQYDSTIGEVQVYYFRNTPANGLYTNRHLTQQARLDAVLDELDEDSSVLVVSDAGAARGHNDLDRIIQTEDFLNDLYCRTNLITWLNPMPVERWQDTSAEAIARFVPMFPMNEDGMSNALDALRGLAGA